MSSEPKNLDLAIIPFIMAGEQMNPDLTIVDIVMAEEQKDPDLDSPFDEFVDEESQLGLGQGSKLPGFVL